MNKTTLSAVVIAQNSASVIEKCLQGLQFADEIVVVDALSYDRTPEIVRRYGGRVVSNPWPGYAAQKQLGIDRARGEWVFLCDTDESVPEPLAREIRDTIAQATPADGYRVRRRNQFLGEWIDVGPWTDDSELRLFRRDRGHMTRSSVHEGVVVDGTVRTLRNPLYHFTHPSVTESIERLNRYTTLESRDRVDRRRIRLIDPLIPPLGVFVNYYFAKGCWRAGVRGFLLSAITAMYKSVLYVKIYLLQRSTTGAASGSHRLSDNV
jgi:glycosyltransferase involved in cell wall biosynthesis